MLTTLLMVPLAERSGVMSTLKVALTCAIEERAPNVSRVTTESTNFFIIFL
jgi:hypothetical protein